MKFIFNSTFRAPKYKEKFANDNRKIMLDVIAVAQRNLLKDLTAGLDPDGLPLANQRKYSESYATFKANKTGRPKGKVDLQLTGNMLKTLQTQVSQVNNETIGRLYFLNLYKDRVVENLNKWKFFGFSKATMSYFIKKFKK